MKHKRNARHSAKNSLASAMLTLATLAGASAPHAEHAHDHGSASASASMSASALTLNQGKKWATDAPLRQGMKSIQALIAPLKATAPGQSIAPAKAKAIADGVNQQIAYLVTNCKLDPKADEALHVLLADIIKGADNLAGNAPSGQGIASIDHALTQYPRYFAHPGWIAAK